MVRRFTFILMCMSPCIGALPLSAFDLATGIVYPSGFDAAEQVGASLGLIKGERLGAMAIPVKKSISNQRIKSAYYFGSGNYGFGFAADWHDDSLSNSLGAGFNAKFVHLGLNLGFNSRTFNSRGHLSVRYGNKDGMALAASFTSALSTSQTFLIGIGYAKTGWYHLEINTPFSTEFFSFSPEFGFTYTGLKSWVFNVRTGDLASSLTGNTSSLSYASMRIAIMWWFTNRLALSLHFENGIMAMPSIGIQGTL